jgi:hypothetical protein
MSTKVPARNDNGDARALALLDATPPWIPGEDRADYEALLAEVIDAVRPKDVIERIWVRDVVCHVFESQRLRRLKNGMLRAHQEKAFGEVLQKRLDADSGPLGFALFSEGADLAAKAVSGDADARQRVQDLLAKGGYDEDMMLAKALELCLDNYERVDRLIMAADSRRDRVLSEVERRRESVARRLRLVSDDILERATEKPTAVLRDGT